MEHPQVSEHDCEQPGGCLGGLCAKKEQVEKVFALMYAYMSNLRHISGGILLTFVNNTDDDVDLIWRDFDDDEVPIIKLEPHESQRISTLTTHNWNCRHTLTGRSYLLNLKAELNGSEFLSGSKQRVIQITAPKTPASLKHMTVSFINCHIKNPLAAFKLPLPYTLQYDLYNSMMFPMYREYYSKSGENGIFRKSYDGHDQGPWIYPVEPISDW